MIPGELVEQYVGHAPGEFALLLFRRKLVYSWMFRSNALILFTRPRGRVTVRLSYLSKNWRIVLVPGSGLTCARIGLRNKSTGFAPMRDG